MSPSSDPNSPSYEPPAATGGGPNLGHGDEFGVDLYDLYRAGRLLLPDLAVQYSGYATTQDELCSKLQSLVDLTGSPAAMTNLMSLSITLQEAIRNSCLTLRDVGPVLVEIADAYAKTDEDASASFRSCYDTDKASLGYYETPTPTVATPPDASAPPTQVYGPGGELLS